ncbi:MAG: 6-phosphogluconolactonase [Deinococcales bacterium]
MNGSDILRVDDVAEAAQELFERSMVDAVERRGHFVVTLSGGSTPLPLYHALSERTDLPWPSTWVLWGDERYVPPDHPENNAGAARDALLDAVPVPEAQVLAWPFLDTPEASAAAYAKALQGALGSDPTFDLTLLGLGADGHTASLFPGTGAALETGLTLVVRPPDQARVRLSLSASALSRSRQVAFLVKGEGKRAALEGTLMGSGELDRFPARAISALERLLVITDLDERW